MLTAKSLGASKHDSLAANSALFYASQGLISRHLITCGDAGSQLSPHWDAVTPWKRHHMAHYSSSNPFNTCDVSLTLATTGPKASSKGTLTVTTASSIVTSNMSSTLNHLTQESISWLAREREKGPISRQASSQMPPRYQQSLCSEFFAPSSHSANWPKPCPVSTDLQAVLLKQVSCTTHQKISLHTTKPPLTLRERHQTDQLDPVPKPFLSYCICYQENKSQCMQDLPTTSPTVSIWYNKCTVPMTPCSQITDGWGEGPLRLTAFSCSNWSLQEENLRSILWQGTISPKGDRQHKQECSATIKGQFPANCKQPWCPCISFLPLLSKPER